MGVCQLGDSLNRWLGTAHAAQPTFPESRHLTRFHRQPYCLGRTARHSKHERAAKNQKVSHTLDGVGLERHRGSRVGVAHEGMSDALISVEREAGFIRD